MPNIAAVFRHDADRSECISLQHDIFKHLLNWTSVTRSPGTAATSNMDDLASEAMHEPCTGWTTGLYAPRQYDVI